MNIRYQAYEKYLNSQKLPLATIKRKLSSLHKFDAFLNQSPLKKELGLIDKSASEPIRIPASNFTKYLLLAILILFSTALGIFGYRQIFKEALVGQAYPQAPSPTTPNRLLSFQARLTDSSDNPIGVPTDFRFIIYNSDSASGSAKLWEEQRYIDPDQDGIFSVTLGTETVIPASVFSENANLWLGVTVQRDPEATPRQRIATVAYALNAETLQGFPPSASASANQIPVLTQEGDLVLAAAAPMLYSSSGTFSIKGQALTITTDTGTNGDIQIAPDGTGNLDVNLSSTTKNGLDITNAAQTSGHLISGYVGNDTATGDLLNLSSGSSPTEKFAVDTSGNTTLAGDLTISGGNITSAITADSTLTVTGTLDANGEVDLGDGGDTMTLNGSSVTLTGFNSCTALETNGSGVLSCGTDDTGAGGSSNWRIASGALSPINDTLDLLIGSNASASAKFAFLNVNSGTPTASISGSSAGFGAYLTGDGTLSTTLNRSLALNPTGGNVGIGTTAPTAKLFVDGSADDEQLIVQAHSSQTANLQEWQNSSGTVLASVLGTGEFGIGVAPQTYYGMNVAKTLTQEGAGLLFSVIQNTAWQSGYGFYGDARTTGTGANTYIYGGYAVARPYNSSPQTLQRTVGLRGEIRDDAAYAASNVVNGYLLQGVHTRNGSVTYTNMYGLGISALPVGTTIYGVNIGGITATTSGYGLYLNDVTGAATNNYAIYTNAGNNMFNAGGDASSDFTIQGDTDADLFFADASADQVQIGKLNINGAYTFPTADGTTNYVLQTNGSGTLSWVAQSVGGSSSNWRIATGALSPINDTLDLLIGANASSSAKFAFLNVNSGTPTASFSGNLVLNSSGTIQTTNNQTLTLGGATTGDIFFQPNADTGDYLSLTSDGTDLTLATTDGSNLSLTAAGTFSIDGTGASNVSATSGNLTLSTITSGNLILLSDDDLYLQADNDATNYLTLSSDATDLTLATTDGSNLALDPAGILTLAANVTFTGTTTLNSIAYTWPGADGTDGYVLKTNGSGTLSWVAQSGGSSSNWRIVTGALSPINDTLDLLIGANATTSAKFAFLNVNSGTPTASISGSTAGNALSLTGDGTIATSLNRSLLLNPDGGNVGIGTSSPASGNKLHVAGQCVTGDSLLPIVKDNFQSNSNELIFKQIKDIKGGEKVLSLNEQTGKIEPHEIKGLLDMGVQPVYKLTTEDDKSIRTTGNHPYLTKDGWTKVIDLEKGEEIAVAEKLLSGTGSFSTESNIRQNKSNNCQKESNLSLRYLGCQINHTTSDNSSVFIAKYNDSIAAPMSSVNVNGSFVTNIEKNQAATKLEQIAEETRNWERENFINFNSNTEQSLAVKFVKIASIEYIGEEQVWDIEVKDTHNFVANGIVAHNTYISGLTTLGNYLQAPGATLSASIAGNVPLTIKGASSQTANLQEWQNSSGTNLMAFSGTGELGIGVAPATGTMLKIAKTYTDTSGSIFAMKFQPTLTTAADGTASLYAFGLYPTVGANGYDIDNVMGMYVQPVVYHTSGATIANLRGISIQPSFAVTSAGTTTAYSAIQISDPNVGAGSTETITTQYGINIASLTKATNNYAIYTNAGNNMFNAGGDASSDFTIQGDTNADLFFVDASADQVQIGKLNINGAYTFPTADGTNTYVLQTNGSGTLSWVAQTGGANYWRLNLGTISPVNDTLDFLVGANATDSAKFAVLNVNSGTPVASISAGVAGATYLTADGTLGTTANQALTLAANVIFNGKTTLNSLTYTWPGSQTGGYILKTDGSGTLSWNDPLGFGYWRQSLGALSPINDTLDLLIGGNASESAKFAFLNVNSGTPTASFSGNLVLNSAGTIQTTNNQTLTLGGATTGNILLQPSSNTITLVQNNSGGAATLQIDQLGTGDVLTASVAGTTVFRVDNSGYAYYNRYAALSAPSYYLDPASINVALNIAGDAVIGGGEVLFNPISSPTTSSEGNTYYDSDTNHLFVYSDFGGAAAWHRVAMDMTKYTANNASVANNSALTVNHAQGINDLMATGWVYDGAKYVQINNLTGNHSVNDPSLVALYKMEEASGDLDNAEGTAANDVIDKNLATGAYQQAAKLNYGISFDGSNDYFCSSTDAANCTDVNAFDFGAGSFSVGGWFKHNTISTNPDNAIVKYSNAASIETGDGADGPITVSSSKDINAVTIAAGRSYADGIAYRVIAPADSATSVDRYSGSDNLANGLAAGDEVLLINLQGSSADYTDSGNYEFMQVQSVTGSTVTFTEAITKSFDGTTASNQKVIVQRVPNYTSVSVQSGGTITASAFDNLATGPSGAAGYYTGIVAFRATGAVTIDSGGTIATNAKGFPAGTGGSGQNTVADGADAFCSTDGGGDGGIWYGNGQNGNCGGGGGGGAGGAYTGGTGSSNLGGGGGGGGNAGTGGTQAFTYYGGGGGGGGYGTIGYGGTSIGNSGNNGTTDGSSGNGGNGVAASSGGGGGGGSNYGDVNLADLFLGSGGAGGGSGHHNTTYDANGGAGGKGGGIIFVAGSSIAVSGTIQSQGGAGAVGLNARAGAGGGGAGGSIYLSADTVSYGANLTTTTGGTGGAWYSQSGGNGGYGRIHIDYITSLTGSNANETEDTDQLTADSGGYKLYMNSAGNYVFGIDDDFSSFPEDSATSGTDFDDNNWHHIVAVKTGNDSLKLYVDGREVGSDYSISATGSLSNADEFYLGVDLDASTNPWEGLMDEVFVYNRPLSAGEVEELYQTNTKYYIEQTDTNNVKLYNYSGEAQNLRLDIVTFGADLAEWYTVDDQSIGPADVVSLTGSLDEYSVPILRKANQVDDPQLTGIISTKAGQTLGLEADNRRLLALAGRVPVKIASASAAIQAGDYLTSAPNGEAQKALPGELAIGKALEPWSANTGKATVLVLVGNTTTPRSKTQIMLALIKDSLARLTDYVELTVTNLYADIINANKIIAPTVESERLVTNFISPLPDNPIITIAADVSVSGTLVANKIVTDELVANKIKASSIEGLREKIANIFADYSTQTATASGETVDSIKSLVSSEYDLQNTSSSSAYLDISGVNAEFGFFKDYLAVMGTATISDLKVNNQLAVNSISSLDNVLSLQPSGIGSINFLAGLMILDDTGTVLINGNVKILGQLSAPTATFKELLTLKLEAEEAKINKLTTEGLTIALPAEATPSAIATDSASIATNATAGKAVLPAGMTEFTINTPFVTTSDLVYVTPLGDTQNQVLYVKSKKEGEWFKVAINQPLPFDLEFNWWIIRLEDE